MQPIMTGTPYYDRIIDILSLLRSTMPKGLKSTSSMIVIGARAEESAAGTLTTEQISLQLNALDNEVFVVTAVDLNGRMPDQVANGLTVNGMFLTKQDPNGTAPEFNQSNVIAAKDIVQDNRGGDGFIIYETSSIETPPTTMDYLDIIATPDAFLTVQGSNNAGVMSVACKIYGYRARADAATYAALVQSEVLSS